MSKIVVKVIGTVINSTLVKLVTLLVGIALEAQIQAASLAILVSLGELIFLVVRLVQVECTPIMSSFHVCLVIVLAKNAAAEMQPTA